MNATTTIARKPLQQAHAVLLVDDEPQALKWFARQYGDEFLVLTASSVAEALSLLNLRGQEVAVLLTDYRMPQQDGVELLAIANARFGHVSRLLMSAYADKAVAMAAVNRGHVEQILEKPLDESLTRRALRDGRAACHRRLRDLALLQRRDESLRETLGFLAHEVGTPMATVSGYLSAMRERQQTPACGNHDLVCITQRRPGEFESMLEAAQRRTDFAHSLVATFVRTALDAYHADRTASDLASDLVHSVREGYPFDAEEADWLSCKLSQDFRLPGQRDLLYLVLCTLVKNALFALRTALPLQPLIVVEIDGRPEAHAIRIRDNGPGIAPEVLARLTHEPVTTKAATEGSGMGLLFCQRVLNSLGGNVVVQSGPGGGTTVSLCFAFREVEQVNEVSR
jgi:two-component system response regulator PhcR